MITRRRVEERVAGMMSVGGKGGASQRGPFRRYMSLDPTPILGLPIPFLELDTAS
jgi:hypothetical protein